jgi:hypothetical protein
VTRAWCPWPPNPSCGTGRKGSRSRRPRARSSSSAGSSPRRAGEFALHSAVQAAQGTGGGRVPSFVRAQRCAHNHGHTMNNPLLHELFAGATPCGCTRTGPRSWASPSGDTVEASSDGYTRCQGQGQGDALDSSRRRLHAARLSDAPCPCRPGPIKKAWLTSVCKKACLTCYDPAGGGNCLDRMHHPRAQGLRGSGAADMSKYYPAARFGALHRLPSLRSALQVQQGPGRGPGSCART